MDDALAARTWPEVGELVAAGAVLAVPVGSTEQHGPHLPLSTDTDIAVHLCRRLAAGRTGVLVAPPVAYGSSGEHAGFAGTLSIGQAALELLILELGRSAFDTFGRVLFVSAHGGNAEAVTRAVDRLRHESRDASLFLASYPGDAHAGRAETSMQLALDPAVVRRDQVVAGDPRPLRELLPLLRSGGVRSVTDTGVLGDPSSADAQHGRTLLDGLVADLVRHVEAAWPASDLSGVRS
ncbi:mycofactocin biosynthesis peptidyl-dipeptidase MftE [Jatrophihabitans endophyticus]|uniref:mycofactocin biosynthesis peptidyl-dipeptidase MftE n=1 Tax=Jatrophihabitans endophyticus TaxID=1206085 RepID=UPI0019FC2826|nr:mycofactocin biosynthesis peptidyl-dipeptidase MftE [Jatrophihabitans endophyticus]MBE7187815.1 mycofactocin biosynthesis peptidyl-dipeptidase MftE [Jatrophihabitans endophyticus]